MNEDAFLYENPMSSPFGRFFPSFQAMAPPPPPPPPVALPQSPRNGRTANTSTASSQRFKVGKTGSHLKRSTKGASGGAGVGAGGGTFFMKQVQRSVIGDQTTTPSNDEQSTNSCEGSDGSEGHYTSLPTPESTVPENQRPSNNSNRNRNSNSNARGSQASAKEDEEQLQEEIHEQQGSHDEAEKSEEQLGDQLTNFLEDDSKLPGGGE